MNENPPGSRARKPLIAAGLFVAAMAAAALIYFNPTPDGDPYVEVFAQAKKLDLEEQYPNVIAPGSTLFTSLKKLDISPQVIDQVVQAAKSVVNLKRIRPGARFQVSKTEDGLLQKIDFWFSPTDRVRIEKIADVWIATAVPVQVEERIVAFGGVVTSSLWESAEKAKMDPDLISDLAEVFAWQIDFARELRVGDRWRITVEQKYVDGEVIGGGLITAAQYENQGRLHSAALFRVDGKSMGYYSPDGSSLRKMFLKSPMRFGRISSRFSRRRFHPILKVGRPHNGVDYAAPMGTSVRSVGAGVVVKVGWQGGGGKIIRVRHNATYETAYKHLSGFAKGVQAGARVEQGQIIGYVGSTGLSTAPHLHFEFYRQGRFVDPLSQSFPSAEPVPSKHLARFQSEASGLLAALPSWDSTTISMASSPNEGVTEAASSTEEAKN